LNVLDSNAAEGAKDTIWIRQLLEEMKIRSIIKPIILLTDNDTAQKLSQDTTYRRRTRETSGKTNPADPLTKLISAPCLKEWMKEIRILGWVGARSI
jgi:hypothetical protein